MKKNVLLIVFLCVTGALLAQAPLAKGQVQLNGGVGFSSDGVPVYVGLDYGVHPDITIGGELSYRSHYDNVVGIHYNYSVIGISGNGNYHFNTILNIPRNWDFYAGANVGFFIWSYSNNYNGTHSSELGIGGQIGGRYYFTDKFGINLEFGGGNAFSGGKFGITLKL
jgi:outer membrane immunogenic protein